MTSLTERLLKSSTIDKTDVFADTEVLKKVALKTSIPMINVALSGNINGGLTPGLLMIAGESKSFKTLFSLFLASTFLAAHKDAVLLFYDSEFGAPGSYFKSLNIPQERVVHSPITDIEILKHDIMTQLESLGNKDKVMILIDSIGNLASRKEIENAIEGKDVADMTRAKALASLFRMVTPHLTLKKIPMVVINHTYKDMGMFPKDIVSGGSKSYLSSNDIWIVKRRQEKEGTELVGYEFIINIEKSRFVIEKSKIPISVGQKTGIRKYSGLFDIALETKHVTKPKKGTYLVEGSEKEYSEVELKNDKEVWKKLLGNQEFVDYIHNKYTLVTGDMIGEDDA